MLAILLRLLTIVLRLLAAIVAEERAEEFEKTESLFKFSRNQATTCFDPTSRTTPPTRSYVQFDNPCAICSGILRVAITFFIDSSPNLT